MNYVLVIVIGLVLFIAIFDYTQFGYEYKSLLSGQKVSVNTGIHEVSNAVICYTIAGGFMGVVGFISASNTGNIQMSLNFGSIGVMFTAFLPMFIGGFIGRFCNEKNWLSVRSSNNSIHIIDVCKIKCRCIHSADCYCSYPGIVPDLSE